MVKVATPFKVCFPLIYIFFEVILMPVIDGIDSFLEDYYFYFLLMRVSIFSIVISDPDNASVQLMTKLS